MLIQADARAIPLRDGCVQCVVTSPPYWGLRDYGVMNQIGLEPSPAAYVSTLTQVFREVRRVLADDSACWLNLGDSYIGSFGAQGRNPEAEARSPKQFSGRPPSVWPQEPPNRKAEGLKPKDLTGIPWRVAFALQADGWYPRSDVIWSKPNPMPESVTDRPTKAHEYLFLLTKSERYYYDAQAIAEPVSAAMLQEVEQGYDGLGLKDYEGAGVQNPSSVKARIIANARLKGMKLQADGSRNDGERYGTHLSDAPTRNRRTVWTVNTHPYTGAHFATMPEKLVEPCILAGSRFGDLVFDPFSGSGTVLAVAERLGRRAVGADLNPAYHQLAKDRTRQRGLRFEAVNE